jgi:hypothetical protein
MASGNSALFFNGGGLLPQDFLPLQAQVSSTIIFLCYYVGNLTQQGIVAAMVGRKSWNVQWLEYRMLVRRIITRMRSRKCSPLQPWAWTVCSMIPASAAESGSALVKPWLGLQAASENSAELTK